MIDTTGHSFLLSFPIQKTKFFNWSLKVLLLVNFITSVDCLKLTKMNVAGVIDFRSELQLECQFDMGGEQLYAVKWYKDDNEFFRYMPHQQPYFIQYPVHGVNLANESTDCSPQRCRLVLTNLLRLDSSGSYRCEVSTDAPAFRLASKTTNVTVAALPKSDPKIEELDESYFEGDILTAKCLSSPSDPPQLITWYINDEPAPAKYVRDIKTTRPDMEGLFSTSQVLRFVVEPQIYKKNIRLKCAAYFDGAPMDTARNATRAVHLYDHETQINDPRYTYWSSSSSCKSRDSSATLVVILLVSSILCAFR